MGAPANLEAFAGELEQHIELANNVRQLLPILAEVGDRVVQAYQDNGTLFSFGNGGSAADAQHLAAELVGHYRRDRRPLPACALTVDPSVTTCIANDFKFDDVFARQVAALVSPGDVVVGFTTSGRSPNVVNGLATARAQGATTVLFGGGDGLPAATHADYALVVPSAATARVQEMHLLMLHILSEHIDAWATGTEPSEES